MKHTLLATCASVIFSAFSVDAFAEYQSPTAIVSSGALGVNWTTASIATSGDGLTSNGPALSYPAGSTETVVFTIPDSWRNDLRVFVETPSMPGVSTTAWQVSAVFSDSGGGTSTYSGAATFAFSGSTIVLSTFSPTVGFLGAGRTLTTLTLTIQNVSGAAQGGAINVGLVSNPEPGTLALFGIGALALGGAAWRRRKAVRKTV
jgi:hypothetical protein